VLSFFSKKTRLSQFPFGTDIHSHLLPGIDDGVATVEESEEVIRHLMSLGFARFVTTPHINEIYKNTPDTIHQAHAKLLAHLGEQGLQVPVEVAAEYYLDDKLMGALEQDEPLLTFGLKHLLFETNFLAEPYFLKDFLFKSISQGYRPLMAHPERYHFMTLGKAEDLRGRGVLFQVNLLSLTGYYSPPIRKMAERLIEKGWVDFLGSDCHNMFHAQALKDVLSTRAFKKALDLELFNNRL
jgi:protein-tyrosine phosphatase